MISSLLDHFNFGFFRYCLDTVSKFEFFLFIYLKQGHLFKIFKKEAKLFI